MGDALRFFSFDVFDAMPCGASSDAGVSGPRNAWARRYPVGGQVATVLEELRECLVSTRSKSKQAALKKRIRYYTENNDRMNYKAYREQGFMIGSGIIESGHKHILQARMKKSGQHWSQHGAEKMARLRALYKTHGPEHFYDAAVANTNSQEITRTIAA